MKKTILFSTLIAVGSLGFAATASAQNYTCDDIIWGPEILADNPNIGDACLDLVEKGGTWVGLQTGGELGGELGGGLGSH